MLLTVFAVTAVSNEVLVPVGVGVGVTVPVVAACVVEVVDKSEVVAEVVENDDVGVVLVLVVGESSKVEVVVAGVTDGDVVLNDAVGASNDVVDAMEEVETAVVVDDVVDETDGDVIDVDDGSSEEVNVDKDVAVPPDAEDRVETLDIVGANSDAVDASGALDVGSRFVVDVREDNGDEIDAKDDVTSLDG
ncbi:hypothetical protein BRAO285_2640002 [Bradyrhizobium sp. ORS 285]|uniref:hypothetical protein n=1 Tax=Bradyrhizobium sp. ORS 285 TaxID=115808 RepID=UPI0002406D9D|nr:hypothetical protein [Bradyrhizobium sp. ORS 285]CCD87870.1 hypothetical protein BRAO285_2640002 [Bradyrhizobium sp. ORS 285]